MMDPQPAGRILRISAALQRLRDHRIAVLILLTALVLRVVLLAAKPAHFDEGINGWFVEQMWRQGFYRYDPANFHGPLYFYLLQFSEMLLGRGIVALRLVTALLSTAIVAVVLLHVRWFGRAALWAAALLALSPGMVFYGRYAIHESLFVLSQALFLYGFLRWRHDGGRAAVTCMVAGVVGSVTTKETFFIFFGTWAIALGLAAILNRWWPQRGGPASLPVREPVSRRFIAAAVLTGVGAVLLLFSGFLMNPAGLKDMIGTFALWTQTGTGATGHEKPFHYWLTLLLDYEWPALVTLVALPALLWHPNRWSWPLGATAFGLIVAYSLIPYKTPWLILDMLLPLALCFGLLLDQAGDWLQGDWKPLPALAVGGVLAVSAAMCLQLNFRDHTDFNEPYVYVQTSGDVNRLLGHLETLVDRHPEQRNVPILVLTEGPWPLPWLLGEFPGLTYGNADSPGVITADVVIAPARARATVEAALPGVYVRQSFQIRDAGEAGFAYYRLSRFGDLMGGPIETVTGNGGVAQR